MNFYKTLGLKNSRIDVADALRGFGETDCSAEDTVSRHPHHSGAS